MSVFNTITGHLTTCVRLNTNGVIYEESPFCLRDLDIVIKGENRCEAIISKQSCIHVLNSSLVGLCNDNNEWDSSLVGLCNDNNHWESYCKLNDWDKDLSYCANVRCDRFGMNLDYRRKLDQYNIADKLEFSINSSKREFNHVSDFRRHEGTEQKRKYTPSSENKKVDVNEVKIEYGTREYNKHLPYKKRKINVQLEISSKKVQKRIEIFTHTTSKKSTNLQFIDYFLEYDEIDHELDY